MESRGTGGVTIVTLLDDSKADTLATVVGAWRELDTGGRPVGVVALAQDASDETVTLAREAWGDRGEFRVCRIPPEEISKRVPDLEWLGHEGDLDGRQSPIYLHRMAVLREAARQAVLELPLDEWEWVFWLDADVAPPPIGLADLQWRLGARLRFEGAQPALSTLMALRGFLPGAVSGIYPTRDGGQMRQWLGDGTMERYIPLRPGKLVAARVAGFGCVLMTGEVLQRVGWEDYGLYRQQRRRLCELGQAKAGPLGEDVYWFRCAELEYQVPLYLDCDVRCRHYDASGGWWEHEEQGGLLEPVYHAPDTVADNEPVPIGDTGLVMVSEDPEHPSDMRAEMKARAFTPGKARAEWAIEHSSDARQLILSGRGGA